MLSANPETQALSTLSHPLPIDRGNNSIREWPSHLGRSVPGATHNDAPSAIHTVHLLLMSWVLDGEGAMNLMNTNLSISRREIKSPPQQPIILSVRKEQVYRNSPRLQWHPNLLSYRQFSPIRSVWSSRYLYFLSTLGAEQSWETKQIPPLRVSGPASLFIKGSSCFPSQLTLVRAFGKSLCFEWGEKPTTPSSPSSSLWSWDRKVRDRQMVPEKS